MIAARSCLWTAQAFLAQSIGTCAASKPPALTSVLTSLQESAQDLRQAVAILQAEYYLLLLKQRSPETGP